MSTLLSEYPISIPAVDQAKGVLFVAASQIAFWIAATINLGEDWHLASPPAIRPTAAADAILIEPIMLTAVRLR